ncbi:10168_t:CDS:2 [Gigaspora margarita]|uniref:10168_t:CDS:1 n=1 Tax=Gigaspora margarita TaxID=4874 RepID=A0ABM8W290_GIGMA|nr:10168_t:CDS:2 [Gigaspora margarita]
MTTLQEYLDSKYPTKENKEKVKEIIITDKIKQIMEYSLNRENIKEILEDKSGGVNKRLEEFFEGLLKKTKEKSREKSEEEMDLGELDLTEYPNLEKVRIIKSCFLKNPLTKLELGTKLKLMVLDCYRNKLTSLDISGCPNLTVLDISTNRLTNLDISKCTDLKEINCAKNNLNSVDFLTKLPNPEKLEELLIYDNNIQPTTLDFLRPFVNLKDCKLGLNRHGLYWENVANDRYNRFYGSLEPIKNLTKLEEFCIAGTDVEEGLEYIPTGITELSAQAVKEGKNAMMKNLIDCQPLRPNSKVQKIQDELQLDKVKTTEKEKFPKIARLETKIQELELAKSAIEKQTQTDFSTQDKGTQTDLTAEQIKKLEWKNKQLRKNYEKETQSEVKEATIPSKIDSPTPQTEEEIK